MTDFSRLPPECDDLCQWRKCLRKGEDKGTYVAGRGYTSYYEKPRYVCMTRMLHGCPDGPIVNDNVNRPIPDLARVASDLESMIHEVRATNKAKAEMQKMLHVIRLLTEMIEGKE